MLLVIRSPTIELILVVKECVGNHNLTRNMTKSYNMKVDVNLTLQVDFVGLDDLNTLCKTILCLKSTN